MTIVTKDKAPYDAELNQLLAELGGAPPSVPAGLTARILADAATVQAMGRTNAQAAPASPSPAATADMNSLWRRIAEAVGGGRVIAGLGTAALAGIALGFLQPAPIEGLTGTVWGQDVDIAVDLLPGTDEFWTEG